MKTLARAGRWWQSASLTERGVAALALASVVAVFAVLGTGGGSAQSTRQTVTVVSGGPLRQVAPVSGTTASAATGAQSGAGDTSAAASASVSGASSVGGGSTPASTQAIVNSAGRSDPGILGTVVRNNGLAAVRGHGQRVHAHVPARPAALGPLAVGVDYQDAGAANSFFRQYGVDAQAVDPGAQAQATADWINQHGGLLGHRLVLRLRHFDFYRDRLSVLDQVTCSDFASAPKVLADVDRHASTDVLIPCLARHDIPTLVDSEADPALADFARWPAHLFSVGSAAVDRPQAAFVQGLQQAGFFGGGRVGILEAEGLPQFADAVRALKNALASAGVQPVADAVVSTEDPASFFASEASAELKLRFARVSRVVVFDDDGVVSGQFMRLAEAQGYHPVYGVNSIASPQFLAYQAPKRQLEGAVAVGWSPLVDVPNSVEPPGRTVRSVCDQAFAAAGVGAGGRTPFGQYTAYQTCGSLLAIQAAVTASRALTTAGLRAGLERTGTILRSPLVLAGTVEASRHDAAAGWQLARFYSDCGCFQYEGGVNGM